MGLWFGITHAVTETDGEETVGEVEVEACGSRLASLSFPVVLLKVSVCSLSDSTSLDALLSRKPWYN